MYPEERLFDGTIVKIKITGERGMVLKRKESSYGYPDKYLIRVPDYREIVFERMEIEKIEKEGE
jgi:hypothetical protein